MKKAQPGQPLKIPAGDYNAMVDAALDYQRRRQNTGGEAGRFISRGTIRVRNISGVDAVKFGVLGISAPAILPATSLAGFQRNLVLDCVTPALATHAGKFVILAEPIKTGAMGVAFITGVVQVKINVTDAAHPFADVKNADATQLASGVAGGAQILWKESGTGGKWAIIRFVQSILPHAPVCT